MIRWPQRGASRGSRRRSRSLPIVAILLALAVLAKAADYYDDDAIYDDDTDNYDDQYYAAAANDDNDDAVDDDDQAYDDDAAAAAAADDDDDDDDLYDDNDDDDGSSSATTISNGGLALSVCDDSVVAVTYMSVLCDSPYTFYYGNGANRNSYVCDYGDKATLSVELEVVDDLQEEDGEIFFTMAAFDDANNLLMSTYPEQMCQNYLNGMDCTKAGTYNFEKKLKFGTPYGSNANRTKFYPVIHMAFSTKSDSGYNLGAVNTECKQWDQDQPSYVSWSDESPRTSFQEFVIQYGLLIVTSALLAAMGAYIWTRSYDNQVFRGDFLPDEDSTTENSFMEL